MCVCVCVCVCRFVLLARTKYAADENVFGLDKLPERRGRRRRKKSASKSSAERLMDVIVVRGRNVCAKRELDDTRLVFHRIEKLLV